MPSLSRRLHRRSILLVDRLDRWRHQLLLFWAIAASFACAARLATVPLLAMPPTVQIASILPYLLVIGAPIVSMLLALRWFSDGDRLPQPEVRLARLGRWRRLPLAEARAHRLFGVTGIMASVMVGMLIHIPIRTLEFLAAMPVPVASPPAWFGSLYALMLADAVLLCSLYAIAFVAALRRVPLFPRLLATIWLIDIVMQLVIAEVVGGTPGLPPEVAAALEPLLLGNLKKVLISVALWLPYLLLSKRVNVTFRRRVPA